jgi:hypothetical protein
VVPGEGAVIPPAPGDFWQRVIERVATMIVERETRVGGALSPADAAVTPIRPRPPGEREGA